MGKGDNLGDILIVRSSGGDDQILESYYVDEEGITG